VATTGPLELPETSTDWALKVGLKGRDWSVKGPEDTGSIVKIMRTQMGVRGDRKEMNCMYLKRPEFTA